jgi:hypothetical protein
MAILPVVFAVLFLVLIVWAIVRGDVSMAAIAWAILGLILGAIGGWAAASLATRSGELQFVSNALCTALGGGFGAVTGAILGGTSAIANAIRRDRGPR